MIQTVLAAKDNDHGITKTKNLMFVESQNHVL